jgi:hypothetical protein
LFQVSRIYGTKKLHIGSIDIFPLQNVIQSLLQSDNDKEVAGAVNRGVSESKRETWMIN